MEKGEKINKTLPWKEVAKQIYDKNHLKDGVKPPKNFLRWLETKEYCGYECDYKLFKKAFLIWRNINERNYDNITIIAGAEGVGKSRLAMRFGGMISPNTFHISSICFEKDDALKTLFDAKRGDTVLLDEGAIFLFSRESQSKGNVDIVKLLTIIRQLGLNLIICIPNFFIIDNYLRDHRCNLLIQCFKRGHYWAFFDKAIPFISKKGRPNKQVLGNDVHAKYRWAGTWNKTFLEINDINKETYNEHKLNAVRKHMKDIIKNSESEIKKMYYKVEEVAEILGIPGTTVIRRIKDKSIEGKKLGNRWFIMRKAIDEGNI